MKSFMKKLWKSIEKEETSVKVVAGLAVFVILALAAWLTIGMLMVVKEVLPVIIGLLFLIVLFCGEEIADSIRRRNLERDHTCRNCGGCDRYYPAIRTTMFTALRQSAEVLNFQPPETEKMIVSSFRRKADGIPRYSFRVNKKADSLDSISFEAWQACLQETVNDAFEACTDLYDGSQIRGLYIESVREQNLYTYQINVIPLCEKTSGYIMSRDISQMNRQERRHSRKNGKVYDADF